MKPTPHRAQHIRRALLWLCFTVTLTPHLGLAQADDQSPSGSPPILRGWEWWVQPQLSDLDCAQRAQTRACVWGSALKIELVERGATLTYRVRLDRDDLVPILGGDQVAIQEVTVSSAGAESYHVPIIAKNNKVWVQLKRGEAQVRVSISWSRAPDFLFIPPTIAQVTLIERGERRAWVERDARGAVWLKERRAEVSGDESSQSDLVNLKIFRVWRDELPMRVETTAQLNISGRPRELTIKGLVIPNSTPIALTSDLNAEWVRDGLRLYLRPGQATLKLSAVFAEPPSEIKVPQVEGGEVSDAEVWVWHSDETLRSVRLSGLNAIDPDLTTLPDSLKGGAQTWIATPGETLTITELKRGVQRRPSNELMLNRKVWLDLDGVGFVTRDHITGELRASNRLNALTAGVIGRASLGFGDDQPLLITRDPRDGREGVELRNAKLNLYVDGRYPDASTTIPALDWDEQVLSLSMDLHLPPGWKLFSVEGAARCDAAWLNSWKMIEIFFLALLTIGFTRLFGLKWGLLTLLTLTAYHGDHGPSPMLWLACLVSIIALRFAYQSGHFKWTATLVFLGLILTFAESVIERAHNDMRSALHPQINAHTSTHFSGSLGPTSTRRYDSISSELSYSKRAQSKRESKAQYKSKGGRTWDVRRQTQQLDQSAVVQTGPGIPHWRWLEHRLDFDGPVERGREVKLSLISPQWTRIISASRGLSLLILFAVMLLSSWRQLSELLRGFIQTDDLEASQKHAQLNKSASALSISLALLSAMNSLLTPLNVHAWEPDANKTAVQITAQTTAQTNNQQLTQKSDLSAQAAQSAQPESSTGTRSQVIHTTPIAQPPLAQLRAEPSKRLLDAWVERERRESACRGECIYLGAMSLTLRHNIISVAVRVHAERDTLFTLPGPLKLAQWNHAKIGDTPIPMRLNAHDGRLEVQVRVPKGTHDVIAEGRVADLETLSLALIDQPHQLHLTLEGWTEEGARGDQVAPMIKLTRNASQRPPEHSSESASEHSSEKTSEQSSEKTSEQSSEKTSAHQRVSVDLSWYEVKREITLGPTWQMITSVSRADASEAAELILTPVEGERVLSSEHEVTDAGVRLRFSAGTSELNYFSELPLAQKLHLTAPRSVRWSERWTIHCGVIWRCDYQGLNPISLGDRERSMSPTWRPQPGEAVEVKVERPQSVPGAEATVQKIDYKFYPSAKLARGELVIDIAASRGGSRTLTLPEGARDVNLTLNQKQQFDPARGRAVRLSLMPGHNTYRISWSQEWERSSYEEAPPIELDIEGVNLTQHIMVGQRWLLWTQGPAWGPAILFWGKLIVALILALALGVRPWSPLSRLGWTLLLSGLTQHHELTWVFIIGWFALLAARGRWGSALKGKYLFNLGQLALVGSTCIFVGVLIGVVYYNLLQNADMQVSGMKSTASALRWYTDRFQGESPSVGMYSAPLWVWRGAMLAWSLWIAYALLDWIKWAWVQLTQGGGWRKIWPLSSTQEGGSTSE